MQVARRSLVVALAMAVAWSCWMPAARAVLDEPDPDDVASTFDIRRVEAGLAAVPGDTFFQLRVRFFEEAEWSRRTAVYFALDTRSGPGSDYLVAVAMERGSIRATLIPKRDPSETTRLRKLVWDRRVFVSVGTELLRATREILLKVRTIVHRRSGGILDLAPDVWSEWYSVV